MQTAVRTPRSLAPIGRGARRARQTMFVWRLLGAVVLGLGVPQARAAAQGSAGTGSVRLDPVVNQAFLTYTGGGGAAGSDTAAATFSITHQAGVTLGSPLATTAAAGAQVVFAHTLRNTGTDADPISLAATAPAGWPVTLYQDVDGSGTLTAADTPVGGPLTLAAGASVPLLVVCTVPAGAPTGGSAMTISATSGVDPAAEASLQDQITVQAATIGASVSKTVDRSTAAPGDTLRYTIAYAGTGNTATPAATLADVLPAGVAYVPGTLRLGGAALTDPADADAGSVSRDPAGVETLRVDLGVISPGSTGAVTFTAVVRDDSTTARPASVSNIATLAYDTTTIASAPATTRLDRPELDVAKTVVGNDSVAVGGEIRYRLRYANLSAAAPATGVTLADTLPAELALVSAEGAPAVTGQVVQWSIGTLAPGASGAFELVARVLMRPAAGTVVVNQATLSGANAVAVASAASLTVRAFRGDELVLTKAAGVLEVGVGEAVPYTLTLRNAGTAPLAGLVVRDRLPGGMRFLPAAVVGADSARVEGGEVVLFLAGPLAPGAELTVRYAAVLGSPGAAALLENRAVAAAEGGSVRSDTARATVRARRGFALQGRTVIGKVWLDRNDDGRQDADEEGISGVQVWSADGEAVTTDREGRFSFRDVLPGTHGFRLDARSLGPGLRIARADEELAVVRTDGWTTPRVIFRVVPGAAPTPGPVTAGPAPRPTTPGMALAPSVVADSAPLAPAISTAVPSAAADTSAAAGTSNAAPRSAGDLVAGPPVLIWQPAYGLVVGTNRVYVRVLGDPGMPIRLFDGTRLVSEGVVRPDGQYDVIGLELTPGPHLLRAWMRNSWGIERWDSIPAHRSGEPATLVVAGGAATLHADDTDAATVRVRVLDRWGKPVAQGAAVTVVAGSATVGAADADPSSVGLQLTAGGDGWLEIPLRASHAAAEGMLELTAGAAHASAPLRVLPSVRPLTVTGVGQVGVGAAPEAFGAVTVRGALDERTAVTASYDSRRGDAREGNFGRDYDPLDEARYPTFGDGSERRVYSSAAGRFSARVERGLDWLEVGDVRTQGFGESRLGTYQRSLTGARGRVATGPVVWSGFGSVTREALERRQIRGDGSSGPYAIGPGARAATERVAIEVRDRENAARLITRQELVRFTDYEIDYLTGAVLLRRPVPAADAYGNPIFVVATLERDGGGASHLVGGLRMEVDVNRLLLRSAADSLGIGLTGVRDGASDALGAGAADLVGADVRVRRRGVEAGAELLHARSADSTALATHADASWTLPGERARLSAEWLRVGGGFASALDPRLASPLTEVRVGGELRVTDATRLQLRHERQRFRQFDVERRNTSLLATELIGGRRLGQELGVSSDLQGSAGGSTSLTGKVTAEVTPRLDVWVDGSHPIAGDGIPSRPDQVGVGAGYRMLPHTRLELSHRWVEVPGDSGTYGVSSVGLRTEAFLGGNVHGGLERVAGGAGGSRASHAAVLGWDQRLALTGGWSLSTLLERRFGLSRAAISDPVRALPFAQDERNRWSAGAGVEWLPPDEGARFSLRSEVHDGLDRRGFRATLAGDAPLGRGAALITLNDWSRDTRPTVLGAPRSEEGRSLWGLALRPVTNDRLNGLFKAEYRRSVNPLAGTALAATPTGLGGRDVRFIGVAEAIWAASRTTEVAGRYAMRWTDTDAATGGVQALRLQAHFLGARAERAVGLSWLRARLDTRALLETASGATAWNAAPSLAVRLDARIEFEGGYRFGELRDADFGARGGHGAFATMTLRFTEKAFSGPGAFWRERLAREP